MYRRHQVVGLVVVLLAVSAGAPELAGGLADDTRNPPGMSGSTADVSSDPTSISECRTITSSGHYRLSTDLINRTENTCIEILTSDVVFDGAVYVVMAASSDSTPTTTATTSILILRLMTHRMR